MEDQKTTPKRSPRPKQSLAEVLLRTKNLSEGLKANADIMNKRGIDNNFIKSIDDLQTECIGLNHEQEVIKASLKTKTEFLESRLKELNTLVSEARKLVKIAIPQAKWKEFGIDDKR